MEGCHMTIIDGDTLKEAYKNAANIDDREKETAYKMIDQQIEAQKEKFDMLVYDPDWTVRKIKIKMICMNAQRRNGIERRKLY